MIINWRKGWKLRNKVVKNGNLPGNAVFLWKVRKIYFQEGNGTFLGPKVKKWRVIISRFFQISWKFWESVDFGFFGKKWSKKSKFLVLKMFRNLKGQSVSVTKKWELSWGKIHNFLNLLMRNGRKVPQKTRGKEARFPRKPKKSVACWRKTVILNIFRESVQHCGNRRDAEVKSLLKATIIVEMCKQNVEISRENNPFVDFQKVSLRRDFQIRLRK